MDHTKWEKGAGQSRKMIYSYRFFKIWIYPSISIDKRYAFYEYDFQKMNIWLTVYCLCDVFSGECCPITMYYRFGGACGQLPLWHWFAIRTTYGAAIYQSRRLTIRWMKYGCPGQTIISTVDMNFSFQFMGRWCFKCMRLRNLFSARLYRMAGLFMVWCTFQYLFILCPDIVAYVFTYTFDSSCE